jgi:uncharacterized protein involved in exopolysaccharide biosynthesis
MPQDTEGQLTVQEIIVPIWRARKPIALITFAVTLVTVIVNYFFLPHYFKATATLLPETEKGKLSSLSQFADVAKLAGVSIPGSEIARLYPSIVTSETILESVILRKYKVEGVSDSIDLIHYFELKSPNPAENMYEAIGGLSALMSASLDGKTSIVAITLEMKQPQLAADVLNACVEELDNFMRQKKTTNASEQRKWIEDRVKEVEGELRVAEESLKDFREKNRRVSDSPQLLLEQERFARDVQVKSTIFIELKKQYELAKIEEIKNITVVNILDSATAPIKKNRPQRVINTAIFFFLSLLGSSGYFSIRAVYGARIREYSRAFHG